MVDRRVGVNLIAALLVEAFKMKILSIEITVPNPERTCKEVTGGLCLRCDKADILDDADLGSRHGSSLTLRLVE